MQYQEFSKAIQQLIEADGEIDLFEYVLQKVVLRHLDRNSAARANRSFSFIRCAAGAACSVLVSALAHLGTEDPAKAQAAFQRGAQAIELSAQVQLGLLPARPVRSAQVDEALTGSTRRAANQEERAQRLHPNRRRRRRHSEMEAELLRAIADTLDCPMRRFFSRNSFYTNPARRVSS